MNEERLSSRTIEFLEWIEKETGKSISIETKDNIGAGMCAAYSTSPDEIKICLSPQLSPDKDSIDNSVCHEAVHGLLEHKQGYYFPLEIEPFTVEENNLCGLVMTMVDDIVVNKILADKGFSPFSPKYIPQVKREIKALNNNGEWYIKRYTFQRVFNAFHQIHFGGAER